MSFILRPRHGKGIISLVSPSAGPVLQVPDNLVRGIRRVSVAALLVPGPPVGKVAVQGSLQHVDDVVTDDGQELPSVERAARGQIQVVAVRVR